MNIFWLDTDPDVCAKYHVNRHVVKMPLELAQLLCTAHHVLGSSTEGMYKSTHVNHPCAVWVRESKQNYIECLRLFVSLCNEYTYRYGKVHACSSLTELLRCLPVGIPDVPGTNKPQAMPEEYKDCNVVKGYRQYYNKGKRHVFGWKGRAEPPFITYY